MAAADDKKNMTCNCSGMHGGHWTFFLLRTLLMILILMVVFWFGVQVGRMSGGYDAHSEFMMRGGYGGAMPMMQMGATSTPMTGAAGGAATY